MRGVLERLVDVLRRAGHRPMVAVPVGVGGDGAELWLRWLQALEAARDGAPLWLLPNMRLCWMDEANGLLRALRMGPEAARWMSDRDLPLCGDPDEGCLLLSDRGIEAIGAGPGAVLEVLPGELPRLRAPDMAGWLEQVVRLYANAQLEVDEDGWVAPRLPPGDGGHG